MTRLQTDIPSGRLIIVRVDDPLEDRGVDRRYQSIGGSNPSGPIRSLNDAPIQHDQQASSRCDYCGELIETDNQVCPALDFSEDTHE